MQKVRQFFHWLFPILNFRLSFTPFWGFFSFFPHGTLHYRSIRFYLSLEGGPPFFKQSFTCSVLLFFYIFDFCIRLFQLFLCFQKYFFDFFYFRSPLLIKSLLFSFPLVTEMFHFTRFSFFLLGNFVIMFFRILTQTNFRLF